MNMALNLVPRADLFILNAQLIASWREGSQVMVRSHLGVRSYSDEELPTGFAPEEIAGTLVVTGIDKHEALCVVSEGVLPHSLSYSDKEAIKPVLGLVKKKRY